MCAYRIFGTKFSQLSDYADDGEHAGGRAILDEIKAAKLWNFAVFITRFKNGPNLGPQRFIRELTREVIASSPGPLDYGSKIKNQQLLKALSKGETRRKVPQQENRHNPKDEQ